MERAEEGDQPAPVGLLLLGDLHGRLVSVEHGLAADLVEEGLEVFLEERAHDELGADLVHVCHAAHGLDAEQALEEGQLLVRERPEQLRGLVDDVGFGPCGERSLQTSGFAVQRFRRYSLMASGYSLRLKS